MKKTRFDFIISLLFGFVKDIARYGFDIAREASMFKIIILGDILTDGLQGYM